MEIPIKENYHRQNSVHRLLREATKILLYELELEFESGNGHVNPVFSFL